MNEAHPVSTRQTTPDEWVAFPGGELEGKRPIANHRPLCAACRARNPQAGTSGPVRTLCFQCYRAALEREKHLEAAGELDTASVQRFQGLLPFEGVNKARLERLRTERAALRNATAAGPERFKVKQHRAQMAARHVLQRMAAAALGRPAGASDVQAVRVHAGVAGTADGASGPARQLPLSHVTGQGHVAAATLSVDPARDRAARERAFAAAVHAAELQLPASWLPFVAAQ